MSVRLTAFLQNGVIRRREFEPGAYLVGRAADADFGVADARVSREHARLAGDESGWRIEDLASKNGTMLNGRRVATAKISDAAWLSFGGVAARFEMRAPRFDLMRRRRAVEIRRTLSNQTDLDPLLAASLDAAIEFSGCARASLWRIEGGEQRLIARRGPEAPRESRTVLQRAHAEGKPIVEHDVAGADALANCLSLASVGVRALVCFPLCAGGDPIGVLYADSREAAKTFSDLDLELLRGLADQTAVALAAWRLRADIARVNALQ